MFPYRKCFDKTLYDLGVSINFIPFSIFRKLGFEKAKAITVTLKLVDQSITHPRGIIEDVLIKVKNSSFQMIFLFLTWRR